MSKRRQVKVPRIIKSKYIPVYIPTESGAGDLELGLASIRGNTLVIEFNTKLPSEAILRRIQRDDIVGVTFVIPDDEAAEARESEARRTAEIEEAAKKVSLGTSTSEEEVVEVLDKLSSQETLWPEDLLQLGENNE